MDKEVCSNCKNPNESLFGLSYTCGHEDKLCLDCMEKNEDNKKCSNCTPVKIEKIEKCYKCQNNVDSKKSKKIKFSLCETKTHSVIICNDCEQNSYKKLVSKDEKICFLCFVDLDKEKLLYYTEKLNCKDNHEAKLCGKCYEIFEKVDKRCPICDPFEINEPLCIACYNPMETQIKIMPIMCNKFQHKFNLCLNCTDKLDKPYMICRICQNKKHKNYVFLKTNADSDNNPNFLALKFSCNKINKKNLFIDTFSCPECQEVEASPFLIKSFEDTPVCWMNPSSSIISLGNNLLVTGGYNEVLNCSLNTSQFVKFFQDGRIRYFECEEIMNTLNKKRHFHGSYFNQKESEVYIFGGICKSKANNIQFLQTVEILLIPDNSEHMEIDNSLEWQKTSFKLKQKRSNFTMIENQGLVYLFGGYKGIGIMNNTIEVVDFFKKKSRIIKVDITIPILSTFKKNDKNVLFFGGFDGKRKRRNILSFDFKTEKFTELKNDPVNYPVGLRSIEINNNFYIFGGNKFNKSKKKNTELFRFMKFNKDTNNFGKEQSIDANSNTIINDLDLNLLNFYEGVEFQFKITTN